MSRRLRVLVAWLGLGGAACAAGWGAGELMARQPALANHRGQRLADAPPYFVPRAGGLGLCLCRWSTDRPIPVRLPGDASSAERELLERALHAWEKAGLGVAFDTSPGPGRRGIEIEFVPEDADPEAATANTVADCAVFGDFGAEPGSGPLPVELEWASIHLRRTRPDLLGRAIPLEPTEIVGAAVHELGHALGFPGHVARGGSVMSLHGQVDASRRWGRLVESGEPLREPTLAALYALPAGARVGWLPLSPAQLESAMRLGFAAREFGLAGPYVRVGGGAARLFWRDDAGASFVLGMSNWTEALQDPARLAPRLSSRARLLLRTAPNKGRPAASH